MGILEVQNVNKRFGGLQALNNVNLSVQEGTVHAIIGPNGAGKSTLLNCFVGRLTPDTGTVMFDGKSLLGIKPHEINQTGVSRVFQTPEIFESLVQARDHAEHTLADMGLAEKRHMEAGSLSRGDKRRLEMAMCLAQDPKLLLLDEPTAGMARADTNNTIDLLKRIGEERGITKVIIEHDMHVVFSLADRITVLAQGTPIVEDIPANIKGHPKVQEAYLGGAHL
jgi:branched-chain amino acid transport system ATP-binding protein